MPDDCAAGRPEGKRPSGAALLRDLLLNDPLRRIDARPDAAPLSTPPDEQLARRAQAADRSPPPGPRSAQTSVRGVLGFRRWALVGAASWRGFNQVGARPAFGLPPPTAAIPHVESAFGFFAPTSANAAIRAVLAGLLIGEPAGIWLFGALAGDVLKLGLPMGMKRSDLFVLGCVAAIGFAVSLFVAAVALSGAPADMLDGAKMGALLSFFAAALAFAAGRFLGVRRVEPTTQSA